MVQGIRLVPITNQSLSLFKAYGKSVQLTAIDDAIRTAQFIRNSCVRLWMDVKDTGKNDLQKYCAVLAANFPFAKGLPIKKIPKNFL